MEWGETLIRKMFINYMFLYIPNTCVSLYSGVEYEMSPILGPAQNRFSTLEGTNVGEPCEVVSLYLKLTKKIH